MEKKQNELNPLQMAVVELRQKMRLSQQQLAVRLGIAVMTVSRWERTRTPSGRSLERLAELAASAGLKDLADQFQEAWWRDPDARVMPDLTQFIESLQWTARRSGVYDWSTAVRSISSNRHLPNIDRKFRKLLPQLLELHADLLAVAEDTPQYLHPDTKAKHIIENHKDIEDLYNNENPTQKATRE